jgi:hypothetical protein
MAAVAGLSSRSAAEEVIVSTYDGPPFARDQAETLSGRCDGKVVQFRFVAATDAAEGRLIWLSDGRQVADLSQTQLGREWTSRSLLTRKTIACAGNRLNVSAAGVLLSKDGAVRHVSTWARLKDGAVESYGPPLDIEPVIAGYKVHQ